VALRLLSYLAPSIPEDLFQLVAASLEARLGMPVTLEFETRVSGPAPDADPFSENRADLAFVCGPSYALLKDAGSPVVLLPVAPVFADSRAEGRPVYFSDVVVRVNQPARSFPELAGGIWSYNDRSSRSGWLKMLEKLAEIGHRAGPESFFGGLVQAGSHLSSIELVVSGQADAAAIDSNALSLARRRDRGLDDRLRVLESWGPMPIQPLLARSDLDASVRDRIAEALLGLHREPARRASLEAFGVRRFAAVDEASYRAAWSSRSAEAGNLARNPVAARPHER